MQRKINFYFIINFLFILYYSNFLFTSWNIDLDLIHKIYVITIKNHQNSSKPCLR